VKNVSPPQTFFVRWHPPNFRWQSTRGHPIFFSAFLHGSGISSNYSPLLTLRICPTKCMRSPLSVGSTLGSRSCFSPLNLPPHPPPGRQDLSNQKKNRIVPAPTFHIPPPPSKHRRGSTVVSLWRFRYADPPPFSPLVYSPYPSPNSRFVKPPLLGKSPRQSSLPKSVFLHAAITCALLKSKVFQFS